MSNLQNIPPELTNISKIGQFYLVSSKSGYMTRDLFVIWTIHFINFVKLYRESLSEDIRYLPILLIMDGHLSRENLLALYLLQREKIPVLILPSHTSHILQMFDVALASPFKKKYTKYFERYFQESSKDSSIKTDVGKIRIAVVKAIISSWKETSSFSYTETAAKKLELIL